MACYTSVVGLVHHAEIVALRVFRPSLSTT
jgi:hypothetical protein